MKEVSFQKLTTYCRISATIKVAFSAILDWQLIRRGRGGRLNRD
jgi:hypothetical protein